MTDIDALLKNMRIHLSHDQSLGLSGSISVPSKNLRTLLDEIDKLRARNDEACRYLERLLTAYVGKHFDNPDWRPLSGNLLGMLTQMDNASTVTDDIKAQRDAALKQVEAMRESAKKTVSDIDGTDTKALSPFEMGMRHEARAILTALAAAQQETNDVE